VCREFALGVYARADRADRSGRSDTKQVEAFSAAGTFLKALAHFGDLDEDLASRQQYAEWRAWDLATAIQAGRAPSRVDHLTGPTAAM
jgi:vacuolar protein sorting-associated protein VTA1